MAFSYGDLIHSKDGEPLINGLTIGDFKIVFVDSLDRFPVRLRMPGNFGHRHHRTEVMDIGAQPPGNPYLGMNNSSSSMLMR